MEQRKHVYGSIVISATTPVEPFPIFVNPKTLNGTHTENKWRGLYQLLFEAEHSHTVLALPQRNKYMAINVVSDDLREACYLGDDLKRLLTDLDSRYEGARLLYKLDQTMCELDRSWSPAPPYLAVIDNISEHSYFVLLSNGVRTYVTGVYDGVNNSVRLVWTTDPDFIAGVRSHESTRYVFYRYPDLIDRPMFINSQLVCARWFQWSKTFTTTDGLLRIFNALEALLYKDPTVFTGS